MDEHYDFVFRYDGGKWTAEDGKVFSADEVMDLERRFSVKLIIPEKKIRHNE